VRRRNGRGRQAVPNWTVGLLLIVLTIGIHTAGVVKMASIVMRIRVVQTSRNTEIRGGRF